MEFNNHRPLAKQHSFLAPSNFSWINYSEEQLFDAWEKSQAASKGSQLHDLAEKLISLGVKLPNTKSALNMFVNDAIGYRMTPELVLAYSINCFGTTDAISFRDNLLRIHDLKTGSTRVKMTQLEIYAALFCLEYDILPNRIDIELRIYQNSRVIQHVPDAKDIKTVMEKIITFDKILERLKSSEFIFPLSIVDNDEEYQ